MSELEDEGEEEAMEEEEQQRTLCLPVEGNGLQEYAARRPASGEVK